MATSASTMKTAPIQQSSSQPGVVDCCWRRPTTAPEPTPKRPLLADGLESISTAYKRSNPMSGTHASVGRMLTASKRTAPTPYERDGTGSKRRRVHGPDSPDSIVFEECPVYNKASKTTSASCAAGTTYNPLSEQPREIQRSEPAKGCADGQDHNTNSGPRPQPQGTHGPHLGLTCPDPGDNDQRTHGEACDRHRPATASAAGLSSISTRMSAAVVAKGAEEAMPGSPTASLDTSCSSPGQINGKQQQLQRRQVVHVAHRGTTEISQPQQPDLQAGPAAQQEGRPWRYIKLACGAVVDLVLLLKLVRRLGGCQQVTRCHCWSVLARVLGLPADSGMLLMHLYASQLMHLDARPARVPVQ